ncbi:MAG TPA: MBG domain-containing protein [Candidatus Sulfotelmatobacter sp.]|nr:MBG domain-containing protein [Candidatus Sulfotelmatobacter sp.]
MAQATTVFGLSFNVPLLTLTNHNTSACSNYSPHFGGLVSQNFGSTSWVDTNGDTININSNLVDMSLNPVSPGHVSHVDVHTLIPKRPDLRWFANGTCWWGEGPSHHIDNGTTNTTPAYAAAMVNDLASRGFNGLIFSWYGKGDQTDTVAKNVKQYLATNTVVTNFTITIMIVFGDFVGGETTNNVLNNILYCETNYFNAVNINGASTYENEKGHPLLMFFNVSPAYFSQSQMTTMKAQTSANTYWVQEGVGEIGDSWVNMTYLWTDNYDVGNTNWLATNPYNLNVVTNQYSTFRSNPGKQAYGAMCAHFNGTLTKSIPWSLGKYLPSGNGLCEYYRAQEINAVIPTNMTRMQWATWSDYEEGTEIELGTENYIALTTSMNGSKLSWTNTSGDLRTVDHFDVYASTDGVNSALICSNVPTSILQTNLSLIGLPSGNYHLYVDAVGLPCIRDHLSTSVTYDVNNNYAVGWPNPAGIVYGTALGAGQNNATSSVAGIFVYSPPNGTILSAGTNLLTALFTPTDTNTYWQTNLSATLVVAPAPLTVTADAQDNTYGTTQPSPVPGSTAFTSAGLQNSQTIGSVTLTYSGGGTNGTAAAGSTATITPSTATGGTFSAANYSITYDAGTLTVTTAPLTITADAQSKAYGTTLTLGAGQTAFTSGGLENGESIGSVTLTSSGATNTAPVGTYSIVPSAVTGGTFNSANYNISYDNGELTVFQPGALPEPWTNQDIGTVGVAGSASYSNGVFTVSGSGVDIWSTNDSFQMVYQPWTGNGEIVARVTSMQDTASAAKAGLMFRETLNPGSAEGDLFVTPSSGVSMQGRTISGALTTNVETLSGIITPCWLELIREGNYLYGYESSDGVNWISVGTNLYSMTNTIYVGLCVTSKTNTLLNTCTFDNVSVGAPWQNQDIGNVGVAGSSQIDYSNGVVTVSGSGVDIWGSADSFQYLYQTGSGDSAIVAQVTGVEGTSPWAKAAVMIRETLATNSRNTILFLSASNGVQLQGRTATGGSTVAIVNVTNLAAPQWIQLVRSSQNMNAYISADGLNWSWIGTQTNPISTSSYDIGLAVTSKTNSALNTSTFDNVSIQNAWASDDIGSVGVAGDASINNSNGTNSIFTVSGSGQDIWSTNDEFQFVSQPLYGNGQIVARVLSVQETDPWSKAGVMVRDTEAPNAINALLFVAGASTNGVSFQGRTSTGGTTGTFTSVSNISAPYWLKLTRSGSTLTAYDSSNGSSWTQVGTAQTITMSTNAVIGLVVGSKNNTELNTSVFDNVTITPTP